MMRFEDWEKNILDEIKEISDRDLQLRLWFDPNSKLISSFDEVVCRLYDDFDFIGFLDEIAKRPAWTERYKHLTAFEKKLSEFVDATDVNADSRDVFENPIWIDICCEAKKLKTLLSRGT